LKRSEGYITVFCVIIEYGIVTAFQRNVLPPSSGLLQDPSEPNKFTLRIEAALPLKCQNKLIILRSVIKQKTIIYKTPTVKAS
jgi:hypothetical protein